MTDQIQTEGMGDEDNKKTPATYDRRSFHLLYEVVITSS